MKPSYTLIFLLPILISLVLDSGFTRTPSLATEQGCRPIGRVLSSSNSALAGQVICAGEAPLTAQALVLCNANGKAQLLPAGLRLEDQNCPVGAATERLCSEEICRRPKGGGENALVILSPVGSGSFRSPTRFSWKPIAAAEQYSIQVEGEGLDWVQRTLDTTLPYPADQQPLESGQTYQITVIAYDAQGNPLNSSIRALNILSQFETERIQNIIKQIQQLKKVDPDELAAVDLKALYLANGLVGEAITALESRVTAGSQNVIVYQALGRCYARARNVPKAAAAYQRAIALAQMQGQAASQKQIEAELNQLTIAWQSQPASY